MNGKESNQLAGLLAIKGEEKVWGTPPEFVDYIEKRMNIKFTLDVAASHHNAKAPKYFTEEDNGLNQAWATDGGIDGHTVWMNPPYGRDISEWLQKAIDEKSKTNGIWVLLPARTDTKWFHELVAKNAFYIYLIKGRLNYHNPTLKGKNAPFPSMLVYFYWNDFPDHRATITTMEPTTKERGF
jgi:phage N-6-adenine-methyltransferase